MRPTEKRSAVAEQQQPESAALQRGASPLSLSRLRDAFAAMLGAQAAPPRDGGEPNDDPKKADRNAVAMSNAAPPALEISPRSVVEAMLFVGRPDNRPYTCRELAAAMRGVSPDEVVSAVEQLNARYEADAAPYRIDMGPGGCRLVLRDEFARLRDKFYGRVREAKLTPAATEVLALVAYHQPTSLEQINQARGAASGAVLSTLVRRRLVRLERPTDAGALAQYWTTERFLRLFRLESLAALPRAEELDKP